MEVIKNALQAGYTVEVRTSTTEMPGVEVLCRRDETSYIWAHGACLEDAISRLTAYIKGER